ncbi:MAG: enoyl-CoA hydratase/isomerase family protein [Dehalococcoidales bacterium]|nr:enoyl-CoA hydratase/isomerase family protein [Dehalococcoidales bacterium]
MTYQTILLNKENQVAMITLNRPEVQNALNKQMQDELVAALAELKQDQETRVIIITGAGEKAFTAGRDLKEYSAAKATPLEVWEGMAGQAATVALSQMTKPVIAAINGYAIGGGLEMALACDIRLASDKATLGFYEIRRGFFPGGGATWRLSPLVGKGWAMEMILSGEAIDAATAEKIGLVNRVVPATELLPAARKLAATIASRSPAALILAKQAINQAWAAFDVNGANVGIALRALAETNEERAEATRAFVEKKENK